MKIGIFGNGGYASEVADICDDIGYQDIVFIVPSLELNLDSRYNLVPESEVYALSAQGFDFAIGIIDGLIRKKIASQYRDLTFPNLIHSSVTFGRNQRELLVCRKGVIAAAGARFMSSINVGDFTVFGLNCTVGHDCIISDFVSIMPGVNISGNVHIDSFGFIGSGAVVLQGNKNKKLYLNKKITVGAGAVVTKEFLDASVVVGIPARNKNEH